MGGGGDRSRGKSVNVGSRVDVGMGHTVWQICPLGIGSIRSGGLVLLVVGFAKVVMEVIAWWY